ncbi:MAG: tetratricopeptide repeat protein [FCB group bacterium]|nr:tetratricopeptide repeat protein [FCB group bacterium]
MNILKNSAIILKLSLVTTLAVMILSGCGAKGRMTTVTEERTTTNEPISPDGYNHFANANILEILEAYTEALAEYEKALKYIPESAVIRTDYARLLFRLQMIPDALDNALKVEPKTSDICLLIGDCYRFLEKSQPAIDYYRKATVLDPENLNAYWYLAGFYRQFGLIDSAISAYYQVARLSDTYRIWQELGTMLGQKERYAEALTAFSNAVRHNPEKTNINSYLGLASAYDALDSLDRAREILDQAIALDKYDVRIFRHMLSMYLARQDIKNAIAASEQVVALVPSDWTAQRRLGVLLYSDGQLDRADSLFSNRIDFGDENVLNYFYRGRVAIEQKRFDDALGLFLTVTEKEKPFVDGWLNRGFVYRAMDSLDRAIEVQKQGLEYCEDDKNRVRLLFSIGATQEQNGQFHEAVATFQKLIDLDRDNAPALNYLAYTLADRGEQLTYALELIERAIALAPDNGAYIDSYAWVHFKLGNVEMALDQLKKAVTLMDSDPVIFEHLGDVYKAMGNDTEARLHYNRALNIDPDSISIKEKMKQ